MKTTTFFIALLSALFFSLPFTANASDFAGGSGTEDDPYLVATADQLNNVRNHLSAHFRQIADIDLSDHAEGAGWDPIGSDTHHFMGHYNGNGFTITNLFIDRPATDYVGLFAYVGGDAELKNMALENVEVAGSYRVGGLVGRSDGAIIDSYATGAVTGDQNVGGLAGDNSGSIMKSRATGTIIARVLHFDDPLSGVGGLVGFNSCTIENSYAMGRVTGEGLSVGGLVGFNYCTIKNSYAMGRTIGIGVVPVYLGGLVGYNDYNANITNSYATGEVSGKGSLVGGLVGWNYNVVEHSYYDTQTTGQDDEGKGIPRSTEEMMQQDTFDEWDFDDIWDIIENVTYPYLQWQTIPSEKDYETAIVSYTIPELYLTRSAEITLTLVNIGANTWEKGTQVYLGAVGDHDDLAPSEYWRVGLEHDVEPAQLHTFTISVYPQETGTFTTEWQMLKEGEFWFGEKFSQEVEVTVRTHVEETIWQMYK